MAGIPKTPRAAFLAWCQAHAPIFVANAAGIGMSIPQSTQFSDGADALAAAIAAQQTAADAYRAATTAVNAALAAQETRAGDAVRSIRAFAELQADPVTVYETAKIDPPKPASPRPAPGTPYKFAATLLPVGAVALTWKCDNPAGVGGTTYEVMRKLAGAPSFTFLATVGSRAFTDAGLPQGTAQATYQVTAVRSTVRGITAEFTVNLGVGGGVSITQTVLEAPKLAA